MKYLEIKDEDFTRAKELLKNGGVQISGTWSSAMEILGEKEAEYRVSAYETENNTKLPEDIRNKVLTDLSCEYEENSLNGDWMEDTCYSIIGGYMIKGDN